MTPVKDEEVFKTNREILSDTHKKVTQLYNAMYGDKESEMPGIVHRVKKLEIKDQKRTGVYTVISALGAGLALAVQAIFNHNK